MSDDQDWRLRVELDRGGDQGVFDRLMAGIHHADADLADDAKSAVAQGVVVTHDGSVLHAYASSEPAINAARRAIEDVSQRDGYHATVTLSYWDHELDEWRDRDESPSSPPRSSEDVAESAPGEVAARTFVCSAGKLVRNDLEQSMLRFAAELGVDCEIVEHPHLLTTQVAFTVTGTPHKLDEFREALEAEGYATLRADAQLLIPLR